MKKLSIVLLAALAMISCGNSYKAQDAVLTNETDSVNHALGVLNGLQIKMYYLANDSSDEAVAEFIDALEKAYLDKEEKLSDIEKNARQFGASVKSFEKKVATFAGALFGIDYTYKFKQRTNESSSPDTKENGG